VATTVPALARALDVLELFLSGSKPLSIAEIVEALGVPRSTAHDIVNTLADRHFLQAVDGVPRRFRPGMRLLQLGNAYIDDVDLAKLGREVAALASAECDETVHVAILEGTSVVYIAKADSTRAVRLVSRVGGRLPANCTACGKALLAGLDDGQLDALYGTLPLPAMTQSSISSLPRLKRELSDVRASSIAFENCESNQDAACVACAVRDGSGEVVAALSISVPVTRWSDQHRAFCEGVAVIFAQELSTRLGYRPKS
jgi:IclR family KDG regulon transcriptional repressor